MMAGLRLGSVSGPISAQLTIGSDFPGSTGKWHATKCSLYIDDNSGTSTSQTPSFAIGHLVWKTQPGGGLAGLGTSPERIILPSESSMEISGIAERSA